MSSMVNGSKSSLRIIGALVLTLLVGVMLAALSMTPAADAQSVYGPTHLQVTATPTCAPGWSLTQSPNTASATNSLNGVVSISANDVWAVGHSADSSSPARTLTMRWNGAQWSIIPSPSQGNHSYLHSVAAVSANDVWAVGRYVDNLTNRTLIMRWDGTQWSIIPSPNQGNRENVLTGIAAISANDMWAVGYYYDSSTFRTQPLTMRWDGNTWSLISAPSPDPFANSELRGVTAVSSGDVWAVGYFRNRNNASDETLILRWNGTQWSRVASPNLSGRHSYLNGVAAVSANDIWAVGSHGYLYEQEVLSMRWNGSSWNLVSIPDPPGSNNYLKSVTAISPTNVWAVGYARDGAQTVIEHWNGTNWRIFTAPNINYHYNYLNAVSAAPTGEMMAVGSYSANGLSRTLAVRYPSSECAFPTPTATPSPTPVPACGLAWRRVPNVGNGNLMDVAVLAPNDVWAVGTEGSQTRTLHWDGAAWSTIPSPNPGAFNNALTAVAAVSPSNVWAIGTYDTSTPNQSGVMVLHWNGSQWSVVYTRGGYRVALNDIAATSANDVWAVGHGDDTPTSALILRWNGTQWSTNYIPGRDNYNDFLYGVTAISPNDVWAVGSTSQGLQGRSLTAHWNGTSWSVIPSPSVSTDANVLEKAAAVSANDVWAVGYHYNNGLPRQTLIMRWNGTEWSLVPSPTVGPSGYWLHGIAAASANDIWASGGYIDEVGTYQMLLEHWDGNSWRVAVAGTGEATTFLRGIAALSPQNVWAVGLSYDPAGTPPALVQHYSNIPCNTATATATAPAATRTPVPTACAITFSDVPQGHTFYDSIRCLACRGIISGYADGTFRPDNLVTRGQLAKIVSNAANFTEAPGTQIFQDVPTDHTFYEWINRLTNRGYMSGYSCGSPGEPCVNNRPYFRPFANATRAQTSKIVSNAARYNDPPTGQTFEDVPTTHPFYTEIQRLASRNIMGGYNCGSPGEPCILPLNRPYFRPYNNVTRGQSSKIVANTFYPNCQTP